MNLTHHYNKRIQSLSAELDTTIIMRLETNMVTKYLDERKEMFIEQKVQILKLIEENSPELQSFKY